MNTRTLLALVVILAIATPALSKELFHRRAHPQTWMRQTRADSAHQVKFTIALKQRNLDLLNDAFESISTPGSPFYRQFLTTEEVQRLVAPAPEHKAAVLAWLKSHDIEQWQITDLSDALKVHTTVAVAEALFETEMYAFTHAVTGMRIARQYGRMAVPAAVADAIELVEGLSNFPVQREKTNKKKTRAPAARLATSALRSNAADAEPPAALGGSPGLVPQSYEAIYRINHTSPSPQNTGIGVISFGESFAPSDLSDWGTQTGVAIPALSPANIIGPNQPRFSDFDSSMALDITAGVAPDVLHWFFLFENSWMFTLTSEFSALTTFPYVISVSSVVSESDVCEDDFGGSECSQIGVNSAQYVARVNTEFQKIGVRGTSILVSSGDSGANGDSNTQCKQKRLFPAFPASSPYVTAVGATQLNSPTTLSDVSAPVCTNGQWACLGGGQEVAVSYAATYISSGGGFSNVAPMPSYQAAAVKNYLNTNQALPPASYFNAAGRGYPDVAALGTDILVEQHNLITARGGTAASAPIWAAVVGLLNNEVIANTGKPLGFLNPLLYQIAAENPSAFTDITVGDNICTEQGCASTCTGFEAQAGWDPVTGLGSPVFAELRNYIKNNL